MFEGQSNYIELCKWATHLWGVKPIFEVVSRYVFQEQVGRKMQVRSPIDDVAEIVI